MDEFLADTQAERNAEERFIQEEIAEDELNEAERARHQEIDQALQDYPWMRV